MLDDVLPDPDVSEVHSTTTTASPEAVMRAIREVTPLEVPVLVALMAIRSVPELIRGRRFAMGGSLLEGFEAAGFVALRETPTELVYGGIGRYWTPGGGLRRVEPDEFRAFAEPGFAKGALGFTVAREGDRTRVTTETRVATTDAAARRSFGRYWRVIHPGSALIRIAWLRAIRRRAERVS